MAMLSTPVGVAFNVEEATRHCDEKKHTLFSTGEIKKDKK